MGDLKGILSAASSALAFCYCAEAARIDGLKAKLPEIFAKSAAHYKALDAATAISLRG